MCIYNKWVQIIIILTPGTRITPWRDPRVLVKKSLINSYRKKESAEHVDSPASFHGQGWGFLPPDQERRGEKRGWSQQGEVEGLVEVNS